MHTFVERKDYSGAFLPGYHANHHDTVAHSIGLQHIDHIVGNVGWNAMNEWVDFYAKVLGFSLYQHFDDNDISTEYSSLMSKVMANGNGYVKFPINEPTGRRKSQIEEYLDFYDGLGVQHIALATNDITAVSSAEARREIPHRPHSYYTELEQRVGKIHEPFEETERLGILVDRDDENYMLQIFTRPSNRPTVFFEIISAKATPASAKRTSSALRSHRTRASRPRQPLRNQSKENDHSHATARFGKR